MVAGATPFDSALSVTRFDEEEGALGFETDIDPALRTPAFRDAEVETPKLKMDDTEILALLSTYFDEAENARETGFNPRHEVWEENLHAFWMRKDFPNKRAWQAKEVSSFVPNFVERFAAEHRQALTQNTDWVDIQDRHDPTRELSRFATQFTRLILDFAGTNTSGHPVPFEHDFGNMCLTGALMMMAASVTFDHRNGRVLIEQVDPRQCYWDPTGRGLYRVRFWEVDKSTLLRQAEIEDSRGEPLYDREAIKELVAHHDLEVSKNKEESSGAGQDLSSNRTPILIKEWLVDLIDDEGALHERRLIVTANDHTIIRGPEPNPWWHGKDWVVGHPVLQAPLKSVAGRTYVELFRPDVDTYENILNRILDMLSTSTMNAFEINPDLLDDPEAIINGIAPNQTILRAEDATPGEKAIMTVEMGKPPSADIIRILQAARQSVQEAGAQSDISLGQTTSGETTATEVVESGRGQTALSGSISMDIDLGFLGPIAELAYYTGLQHVNERSRGIWFALSDEHQAMLDSRRSEFRNQPITVRARGLTRAAERSRRLRGLLGALNVIGNNELLVAEFVKSHSMSELIKLILEDFGVPIERIALSDEEKFRQDDKRRQEAAKAEAENSVPSDGSPGSPGGAPGGVPGGVTPGAASQTAQSLGGVDPLAPGLAEGLPGDVL